MLASSVALPLDCGSLPGLFNRTDPEMLRDVSCAQLTKFA